MNITEVRVYNFCTFHQQPHSKNICPQRLNSMTLVMNKLLDSKLTKDIGKEEEKNQTIEIQDVIPRSYGMVARFSTQKRMLLNLYVHQ